MKKWKAQKMTLTFSFCFCFFPPCRDQEWQPKEHPRSLLHPVALQAAAAATAAVLPVPGGAQPADQQQHTVGQRPQGTRHAVQVPCAIILFSRFGVCLCGRSRQDVMRPLHATDSGLVHPVLPSFKICALCPTDLSVWYVIRFLETFCKP